MTARPRDPSPLLPGTALIVLWSSGFIGAELGTREAPAATLLAWRYLVAALLLIAWCAWRRQSLSPSGVRRQIVLGLLVQVGYLGFVVGGVALGVPAGTAALVAALQPLVVVVLVARFLSEPATMLQLLGLAVALGGVLLVIGGDVGIADAPWWAYLFPFAGMLSLSVGTVLAQHWRSGDSLLSALTVQTITACVAFWVLAGLGGHAAPPSTVPFWGAVAWVVVLSSFGGYGAYLYVSRTDGAVRASTLLYLTPPTTMLWAAFMFGDTVTVAGLAGLVICAAGVVLAMRSKAGRDAVREVDKHK